MMFSIWLQLDFCTSKKKKVILQQFKLVWEEDSIPRMSFNPKCLPLHPLESIIKNYLDFQDSKLQEIKLESLNKILQLSSDQELTYPLFFKKPNKKMLLFSKWTKEKIFKKKTTMLQEKSHKYWETKDVKYQTKIYKKDY